MMDFHKGRWRLALGRLVNLRYINRWIIFSADLFVSLSVSLLGVLGMFSILHIVIFSVRLSLFVSLGKRGIYELPYEVYINCLTQYISSGICSISSQKRPVERCLRRLLHASLIRARMLLTLLPFVIRGVMGRKRRMKRSLTISSGGIFSSFSCMTRMTWANSVTVRHSTICAR